MIRVIKRYESRKLYDTEESRYVSLEDISEWVREGQEVQVIDNATSKDITAHILTQVILDEGKNDRSFLSADLLHEWVRGGERLVSTGIDRVQNRFEGLVRRSIDRLEPVKEAREEMVHLRDRLADLERTLQSLESEVEEKPVAKKAPTKTVTAKTAPAKKAPAKKASAKKAPAKKAAAKKAPAKKAAPKTSAEKKTVETRKPRIRRAAPKKTAAAE